MNALLKGLAFVSAFAMADHKKDEKGAAFTEYVVLVAFVVAAFATAAATFGPTLVAKLNTIISGI
jgi:Flp pilus assembly pilin Flp